MANAKIISNVVVTYPYTQAMLIADNPGVVFPAAMTWGQLAAFNTFPVVATAHPFYDPALSRLVEGTPVYLTGAWRQVWNVVALTVPEQDAYRQQFVEDAKAAAMQYLNEFANTRDYADVDRCCGYAGSSEAQLAADAAYMVSGRDAVVASAYTTLWPIKSGAVPVPSMSAFLATLPVLAWPHPETWPAVDGTGVL